MIFNPVIQSSGGVYHVEIPDARNTFYPTEAKAGQYVVTTSGTFYGNIRVYDETGVYLLAQVANVTNIEDLPPKVRYVLESAPTTYAPPPGRSGYAYFVMPEENVKIVTS